MSDFPKTRAAVIRWRVARQNLDVLSITQFMNGDGDQFYVAMDAADADTKDAFAEESAQINSPTRARLVHPADPWLQRLVGIVES